MTVVDLFAGPGGWDLGARAAGIDPIGIEADPDTCATRRAAGLHTIRAELPHFWANLRNVDGIIASPPCPAFSNAGRRSGIADIETLVELTDVDGLGHPTLDGPHRWQPHALHEHAELGHDAMLLAEPLRYISAFTPRWIAMEQVEAVLPFWQAAARWLDRRSYNVWVGVLCAADYGVPQVRHRAFLLAHWDRPARPPEPTHAQYPQPTLFGDEPQRWVTMADALGWSGTLHAGTDQRDDGLMHTVRDSTEPAPTITSRSARQWHLTGDWPWDRPATTVQGDPRIWPPGHRYDGRDVQRYGSDAAKARYSSRAGTDAYRLLPAELAVLQSFPPDYPWQGNKTSQGRQIGNAVPPALAHRIIEALTA